MVANYNLDFVWGFPDRCRANALAIESHFYARRMPWLGMPLAYRLGWRFCDRRCSNRVRSCRSIHRIHDAMAACRMARMEKNTAQNAAMVLGALLGIVGGFHSIDLLQSTSRRISFFLVDLF